MWSNLMLVSCKLAGGSSNSQLVPNFIFFGNRARFYVDETEVLPRFGLSIKSMASINLKTQIKYFSTNIE